MSDSGTVISDIEIIARCAAGGLVHDLHVEHDADRPDSLLNRVVSLHNLEQIDLLGLTATPEFASVTGHKFFLLQQFFCEAIPLLDAPLDMMMAAVKRLVENGGGDSAATFPYDAFRTWLTRNSARADEIVAASQTDPGINQQFLAIALELVGDAAIAKNFLNFADHRRQAAIIALGQIRPANIKEARATLTKLLPFVPGEDNPTRFAAVNSAFTIVSEFRSLRQTWIPRVISAVARAPTDYARLALLQTLWRHSALFDAVAVKAILDIVQTSSFTHGGLVNTLGAALRRLLNGPHHNLALDFLTDVLAADDSPLTLEMLGSVEHWIASNDRDQLFSVAVRWLLTGNTRLCETVAHLVGRSGTAVPFDGNLSSFGLTGKQQVALCHKAIAYMFVFPATASSFVVAALRAGDQMVRRELVSLLVYPILMNYRGDAQKYLRSIKRGDAAYSSVRKAIKEANAYFKGAEIKAPIKELWPSAYQRTVARMKRQETGRQIHKQAEKQSVLAGLFHRSTLLYGRKSLVYVAGADKSPVAMDMHTIGHSFELPQLDIIDPVGLDYLLRIFKVSKPI